MSHFIKGVSMSKRNNMPSIIKSPNPKLPFIDNSSKALAVKNTVSPVLIPYTTGNLVIIGFGFSNRPFAFG